jgi:hypothetical protein
MVVHSCNPSTREAEAGGLLVQGLLGQYSKTLPPKAKQQKNINIPILTKTSPLNQHQLMSCLI